MRSIVISALAALAVTGCATTATQLTLMPRDSGKLYSGFAEGTPGELKARLGSTVLEVGFDDDESARAAVAVIGAVAPGGDLHGRVLHITVDDGPKVAMEVLRALDQARLSVGGLALREPSLDDVFLTLTGHRAVEPSVDGLADGDGDGDGDSVAADPGRRPTATTSGGAA